VQSYLKGLIYARKLFVFRKKNVILQSMKPTKEYIEQRFKEYNSLYFEGKLPEIPVQLSRARSYLGQLSFKRRRRFLKRVENYDFVLRISVRFDMPESEFEDTLLHEMIHLEIGYQQLKDTSIHGRLFRQRMNYLNTKYGRHITISHRKTKEEQAQDTQKRAHLICVSTFDTDEKGITVAARSRVFRLWDYMATFPQLKQSEWYLSYDPFFNRYPRALTPKIYRISSDELAEHLKNATPLMRQGGKLYLKRTDGRT